MLSANPHPSPTPACAQLQPLTPKGLGTFLGEIIFRESTKGPNPKNGRTLGRMARIAILRALLFGATPSFGGCYPLVLVLVWVAFYPHLCGHKPPQKRPRTEVIEKRKPLPSFLAGFPAIQPCCGGVGQSRPPARDPQMANFWAQKGSQMIWPKNYPTPFGDISRTFLGGLGPVDPSCVRPRRTYRGLGLIFLAS